MDKTKDKPLFKLEGEEVKYKGKYRSFVNKYYTITKSGQTSSMTWETIDNPYPSKEVNFGVVIVPKVKNEQKLIIIENFRFATGKSCLEFPGGIIDSEESKALSLISNEEDKKRAVEQIAIQAAKRELKEETGFEGEFVRFMAPSSVKNPVNLLSNIYFDPWKSSDAALMCLFEIDKTIDSNQSPQQKLDDCEIITVHEVDIDKLLNFIIDKISNEEMGCTAELYSLALGLEFTNFIN